MVSKLWRYVLECWALWLCDSTDNIRHKKSNMAGMWPWVPKMLLKWEKGKKHTFSFKHDCVHFFVKRLIFWQHQREAVIAAVNLIWVLQLVFDDLQHLLISLARVIKYFNDVELLYPLDKFQTNLIFYRWNIKQKHHFYCVVDTIKVMFWFMFLY